CARDHSGFGFW
nr:immunoglobulin heavy chain junction region [Macaca mulatta]